MPKNRSARSMPVPRAWLHYALIAFFSGVVIYFTMLIRMTEASES